MKIVEALKRLKVIEKRIADNTVKITQYSSIVSAEKPAFGTEDAQKDEINKLIQSSTDLYEEYLSLKSRIDRTNLGVEVEIDGRKYTLNDLLTIKRKLARLMMGVYSALNTRTAEERILSFRRMNATEKAQVIQLYDENLKNENLRKWQDLYDNIDSRLEVFNATFDLEE